jgi:HSP20 family protein
MASLMRWDPFRDLMNLHDVDRLFSDVGWRTPLTGLGDRTVRLVPTMDVFTRGEDLVLRAEIPGIKPEDVDVSVTDDVLTVKAERRAESEIEDEDYLVRETTYGSMERSMRLPEGALIDAIHADYRDGILEITVPKAAVTHETRTHKIALETHPTGELTEHH